jgi:catechol 2,3-dioxygenase-like lactoylglutathione lyase family enzyme
MEIQPLEVYATDSNYAIIKPPGRHFPGCVIQGDTLRNLCRIATRVAERLRDLHLKDEELLDETDKLLDALHDRMLHYQDVLHQHGIRLPYADPVSKEDVVPLLLTGVSAAKLNLLVLKTPHLDALRTFYQTLGIQFIGEQHGTGPIHYVGRVGEVVLELYPAEAADQTRLGFMVGDLEAVLEAVRAVGAQILSPAKATAWGVRAVVRDPDGRSVEMTQR